MFWLTSVICQSARLFPASSPSLRPSIMVIKPITPSYIFSQAAKQQIPSRSSLASCKIDEKISLRSPYTCITNITSLSYYSPTYHLQFRHWLSPQFSIPQICSFDQIPGNLGTFQDRTGPPKTKTQKGDKPHGLHPRIITERKRHTAQTCMVFTETHDQIFGDAHRTNRN